MAVNGFGILCVMVAAYAMVFFQITFDGLTRLVGVQIDLLPGLMVYCGLVASVPVICLAALWSGLCFDALSQNLLGTSVLPLLITGMAIRAFRELVLKDQALTQMMIGSAASLAVPALSFLLASALQTNTNNAPRLPFGVEAPPPMIELSHYSFNNALSIGGLASLVQWVVLACFGALMAPLIFRVFDRLNKTFSYPAATQSSFRADREIRRGRSI
jgi:cell shape-determining protein MreD